MDDRGITIASAGMIIAISGQSHTILNIFGLWTKKKRFAQNLRVLLDWLWQISSFNEPKPLNRLGSNKAKSFFIKIAFFNSGVPYLAKLVWTIFC